MAEFGLGNMPTRAMTSSIATSLDARRTSGSFQTRCCFASMPIFSTTMPLAWEVPVHAECKHNGQTSTRLGKGRCLRKDCTCTSYPGSPSCSPVKALRHFADTFILPSICCMRCHGCMSAVHASAWVLVGPQGLPAVDPHLTGGSDSARLSHGGLCGDARSLLPLRTAESHGPKSANGSAVTGREAGEAPCGSMRRPS